MLLLRKTEDEGDIMKENMKKFVIIVAIVAALFFTYPVNMSRADKEYVKEQLEMLEKYNGEIAFAHISYTGKKKTNKGYIIYAYCAVNRFLIDDKGEVFTYTTDGVEHCIYTDKNYTVLKIEIPDTFADYNKSRRKLFPLPVRIRMIGPSGTSYEDEDFKKAEKILKGRQSR